MRGKEREREKRIRQVKCEKKEEEKSEEETVMTRRPIVCVFSTAVLLAGLGHGRSRAMSRPRLVSASGLSVQAEALNLTMRTVQLAPVSWSQV